jgi:hypothetical protein
MNQARFQIIIWREAPKNIPSIRSFPKANNCEIRKFEVQKRLFYRIFYSDFLGCGAGGVIYLSALTLLFEKYSFMGIL